jgi:magnesium-protoporphyrin IX monomethyl ester (oxidative) cyclase
MPFKNIMLVNPKGKIGLSFASDLIPIGLEYVASSIEDAVENIIIIDFNKEKKNLQHFIKKSQPDLVGITASATTHYEGLRLAKVAKENGITTVFGGFHPTAISDELLSRPEVDIIVRGEGELTMRELVERGSPVGILGLSYKNKKKIINNLDRPLIKDLDSLPFPARHLRRHKYYNHITKVEKDVLATSRGCWGTCNFCCEPTMNRGIQRFRSPGNVIDEILEIVSYHEGRSLDINIVDPNLLGNPKNIEKICDLLKRHKLDHLKFASLARVDTVAMNPRIVKKMCDVGITFFEMGIESQNMKDLNNVKKGINLEVQKKAVEVIRKSGGVPGGTFIIGLPNHKEEEIKQLPVYAKKIGLMAAAFGIVTPFPGTEFYKQLNEEKLIFEKDLTKYDEMHSIFRLKYLNKNRIEELESYCMGKFWTFEMFIEQFKAFKAKFGTKMPLLKFLIDKINEIDFLIKNMKELRIDFNRHIIAFLEGNVNQNLERYTKKTRLNDVIEMSRFLRIIGPQEIQLTFMYKNQSLMSYIIKTSGKEVMYVKNVKGKQENSTFNIVIPIDKMNFNLNDNLLLLQSICANNNIKRLLNAVRLFFAFGIEVINYVFNEQSNDKRLFTYA